MAIKEALVFCMQLGFRAGEVVNDCKNAIRLIHYAGPFIGQECFMLDDVNSLLVLFASLLLLRQTKQSSSCVLTKFSLFLDSFETWIEEEPTWFLLFGRIVSLFSVNANMFSFKKKLLKNKQYLKIKLRNIRCAPNIYNWRIKILIFFLKQNS